MVCEVLYFVAQYVLRLRSPLINIENDQVSKDDIKELVHNELEEPKRNRR